MPIKPGGTNPLQQRERSFIRNGSRPMNNTNTNTSYHNFNSANKSNQARAQQLNGTSRANKPNMEIYRPPSILLLSIDSQFRYYSMLLMSFENIASFIHNQLNICET